MHLNMKFLTCDTLIYTMNLPRSIESNQRIRVKRQVGGSFSHSCSKTCRRSLDKIHKLQPAKTQSAIFVVFSMYHV